ncbi:MAG: glycine cleavage system aminomethyltransferase GcvT [Chloroflexi bacterium]|nr:glycine cleavage system aminomethyltransferase GcvT [Chloroflexota bacterium]
MQPDSEGGALRDTPLHRWHVDAGGRMTPFAGWDMPVYYGGINREALAVRQSVGLFDVSHMGRLELSGDGAASLLQWLTVNDIHSLAPGSGHYSLMLRPDAGILDDLIVYRRSDTAFLLIVNASSREKISEWIRAATQAPGNAKVEIRDDTLGTALLALQGPRTREVAAALGEPELPGRFRFRCARLGGIPCEVSRTGYSGEDGIEIIVPADDAETLWNAIVNNGVEPCGLGARDTLRLEAAYCLYGHEISEQTNPFQAGLSWVVKLQKGDFSGRERLLALKEEGPQWVLAGIEMVERSVPRQDQPVVLEGEVIGRVTSGTFSPILQKSIALAYVNPSFHTSGACVSIEGGGKPRQGRFVRLPFYRSAPVKA